MPDDSMMPSMPASAILALRTHQMEWGRWHLTPFRKSTVYLLYLNELVVLYDISGVHFRYILSYPVELADHKSLASLLV